MCNRKGGMQVKITIYGLILLLFFGMVSTTTVSANADKTVETLHQTIETLRGRIDDRNTTIQALRARLDDRNRTITELRDRNQELRKRLDNRNATIVQLRTRLGKEVSETIYEIYRVVGGDTLYKIAQRFNVPTKDIIEANDMVHPYWVEIAEEIRIPVTNEKIISYTVAQGDTVVKVARQFNVDWVELINYNDITEPWWLEIGQVLEIPKS